MCGSMWNRRSVILFCILMAGATVTAAGGDEEGCLFCHRLGLVGNLHGRSVSLRVWDPPGGPHATLHCSDCHPDAKNAPHAAPPGPANCIGECHGSTEAATASHRKAAFGGLTEVHRVAAAPLAPCRLCHGAGDPANDDGRIVARCEACHGPQAGSLSRGIHARLSRSNTCIGCHPPHGEDRAGKTTISCSGNGCHRSVSEREIRLAGHDVRGTESGVGRSIGRSGLFLLILLLGWGSGRFFSGTSPRKGMRK